MKKIFIILLSIATIASCSTRPSTVVESVYHTDPDRYEKAFYLKRAIYEGDTIPSIGDYYYTPEGYIHWVVDVQ